MTQRNDRVAFSLVAAGLLAMAAAAGCGDDGGNPQNVGEAGSSGASGEGGTSANAGSGGSANEGGTAGTSSAGTGAGGGGAGGGSATGSNIDAVVGAVCDWEYRCCDEGERNFRLSPFATNAETCASRLIFEMRQSNATANPYVSGPAAPGGILGTLGYVVNLARVDVSSDGVDECKASLDARGCATEPDPDARCDGPGDADPCALTNLFTPKLVIGAECTAALTENGAFNDVECVSGATCLDAGHPDNPNDVPTCVKRGLEAEPCTEDDDCDFNFFCNSSGSCTEKGDANDYCSFNDPAEPAPGDEDVQCKAGLSCNPATLVCVPSCTLGSVCATGGTDADLACPADSGCAPLEVAEASTAFRVCTALGNSAASLCNSDADCVATRYCDGTNCQSDKVAEAACAAQNECAAGLHCDIGGTNLCKTNLAATSVCTSDFQCGPSSAGCLDQGAAGLACRNSKLANGAECGANPEHCASGNCEFATDVASVATCVAGAGAGADCDTITTDGDAQSCAAGLLCFGETGATASGECVAQAAPGTSCDNPDGDVDNDMCSNAVACVNKWDADLCTDGAVAKSNGGTGLTCDGS